MALSATQPMAGSGEALRAYERAPGELVAGRYELLRPLGRGGMGEVWVARDGVLKNEVALKFLSRELDHDLAQHLRARFRFEAQVSALVARASEHVVRVHDTGSDGDARYLVMEYVAGRSLERMILDDGRVDPAAFVAIFDRICDAIEAAHAYGIVHRDIKPANVLVGASHRGELVVKVTDFGIAKGGHERFALDRPKETSEGVMIGSPDYMSPEQLRGGDRCDKRIDLWTLAVVAYEALTGRLPFEAETVPEIIVAITTGGYPAPSAVVRGLPPSVDRWFERALAKDPERRFASPRAMATTLREAISAEERAPTPRPVAEPTRRAARWLALGGAVFVAVAVLVLWRVLEGADERASTSAAERAFGSATVAAAAVAMPSVADPASSPITAKELAPPAAADSAPSAPRASEGSAPRAARPFGRSRIAPKRGSEPVDPSATF